MLEQLQIFRREFPHRDRVEFLCRRTVVGIEFRVHEAFETLCIDTTDYFAPCLGETAVAVPREARIAGQPDQTADGLCGQTDIQNGIHHAGHRNRRAGPNRNE